MLSVDAVAVADGEKPLLARPDQGCPPFSLTKSVRLPLSLAHCRDMGSCRLPPPSSRLSYVPQVQIPLQPACTTAPAATSLPMDISLLLCPARTSTGFYVLYLWWVYVSSTSPSNFILITLLQFLCHRDAHLDFGETAQNDPMVKRLQTSFIRKLERCQQIEAWSGFAVQGLGTAWIVFFFSCLCSKISVNFSSSTTLY